MSIYEIGLFGGVTDVERATLAGTISSLVADFALGVGRDVVIRVGEEFEARNRSAAGAASYFGLPG